LGWTRIFSQFSQLGQYLAKFVDEVIEIAVERCCGCYRFLGVGMLEGDLRQLDALDDTLVDPIDSGEDVTCAARG
jgi:hypothetical protein